MQPHPPAIEGRDLVKTYPGGVRALDGVSINIAPNKFFTLLGPSGCGKTTLLRLIAGLETQDSGTLHLHGERLDGLPAWQRPVNTVFQSYAVFPHMTVAENIAFGLQMRRRPKPEITARVAEMLALVQLDGLAHRKPAQLSGGQQQRVALARALANAPKVLLLDEPLAALDLKLRTDMQLELKRLQATLGITFIFVTHDQTEALTMSDRIAVMNNGRIQQLGTPAEIYERPANRFVASFIGETNLLEATPLGHRRYRLTSGDILTAAEDSPGHLLAIRPERLRRSETGALSAVVAQIVYLGTDTTYHLTLPNGVPLRLREQNHTAGLPPLEPGATMRLDIPPTAVRVLAE